MYPSLEIRPRGYILESPFNCMRDEVATFRLLSSAARAFVDVDRLLSEADLEFDSQACFFLKHPCLNGNFWFFRAFLGQIVSVIL